MSEPHPLRQGDCIRFPRVTRPWQSLSIRHRVWEVNAGATGELASRPFPSNRGRMAYVLVRTSDLSLQPGWSTNIVERANVRRLLVKLSEVEPC